MSNNNAVLLRLSETIKGIGKVKAKYNDINDALTKKSVLNCVVLSLLIII